MRIVFCIWLAFYFFANNHTPEEPATLRPSYYLEFSATGGFNYYNCCCDGNGIICTGTETQANCIPGGIFECSEEFSSDPDSNVIIDCDACCRENNGNSCA